MSSIARHKNRLLYIGIILFLFVIATAIAPALLKDMFPMPYYDLVERYAAENNLQITFVYAVIKTESGFREGVVSKKGAIGLMQITEKTGTWIASRLNYSEFSTENLKNPETNVRFGCWYLAYLLDRFNGDSELALAAYNAGEGTVNGWMESGLIGWKDAKIKSLPYGETEEYLIRVNRIYFVYKTLYPDLDS
jgi:soluble lytic murein transglycosylase